eukprot:Rmarinus@m.1346
MDGDIPVYELSVKMRSEADAAAVREALSKEKGVNSFNLDLASKTVVVRGPLSAPSLVNVVGKTGLPVRITGSGEGGHDGSQSAVAQFFNGQVKGVVRFIQVNNKVVVDTSLDGLSPGQPLSVAVHQFGNVAQGCETTGPVYDSGSGAIGVVTSDTSGHAEGLAETNRFQVSSVIGRSVVVQQEGRPVACGVIARSAGIGDNPKRICACDGTVLWASKPDDWSRQFVGDDR